MGQIFYNNVKFLLDLNKEKNNQRKVDFFRETNISRQSLHNWKQGSVPANTTLNRIIDYFKTWLGFELSADSLLNNDLTPSATIPAQVMESKVPYQVDQEKELIANFRQLTRADQDLILSIAQRLTYR